MCSATLFSGESLTEAYECIRDLAADAVLVNCTTPEVLSAALVFLKEMGVAVYGGHANGLGAIPKGWSIQNDGYKALGHRDELTPEMYAMYGREWVEQGAKLIGGCCDIGTNHIRALSRVVAEYNQTSSVI